MASKRKPAPVFAVSHDSMREWVEDALRPLPELSIRRMFGGAGIYSEDTIFGILHEQRVYLKTNEQTRPAFVERGSDALRARSGSVLTAYYEVPADVMDDEEELLRWSRIALDVARQKPEPKRKSTRVEPSEILAGHTPEIQKLAERACAIVRAEVPGVTEAGYPGWHLIGYRAPHYFCFVAPQPDHVRVGFEYGSALPDPNGLLEAMGKQVRFVRLQPGKRLPVAGLQTLIQAALAHRPSKPRARAAARGKSQRV
jgi:DNA transformation protein